VHLGHWVEPWVPAVRGVKVDSRTLPITSGKFGPDDTTMSLLLMMSEKMQKQVECKAGEPTAGTQIALILMKDQGWVKTREWLGGANEWLLEKEKEYPKLATFTCRTIGAVVKSIQVLIGGLMQTVGNQIDDAQTLWLQDPTSTDPTHSQIAKDHDDHPLHVLASNLAGGASKDVGLAIQKAWNGGASADDVVAAASRYVVHPSHIRNGSEAVWVLMAIDVWARSCPMVVAQLGSRTWVTEWAKKRSADLAEMRKRADELSGTGQPEQDRLEKLRKGKKS
jgi:hypothetical protein